MSHGLPSWFGVSLACGCIRGVRLCRDAEQLWDAVADAHNVLAAAFRARVNISDARLPEVDGYNRAMAAFQAHIEIVADDAVQGAIL